MAPTFSNPTNPIPFSPAELSYLHASLSQNPPLRPDGRLPTQFRPLVAETDVLPTANGSARVCFSDGSEAVVGVKAEVERTVERGRGVRGGHGLREEGGGDGNDDDMAGDGDGGEGKGRGSDSWVELSVDMAGTRDDDAQPVFLAAMLSEALLATGALRDRLWINRRFHWKLYIDVSLTLLLNC